MMTLTIAAALAAQAPAAPVPATDPMAQHHMSMQMGKTAEHKAKDCCKDCCKDMAAKHDGQGSEHAGHNGR